MATQRATVSSHYVEADDAGCVTRSGYVWNVTRIVDGVGPIGIATTFDERSAATLAHAVNDAATEADATEATREWYRAAS